MKVTELIEKGKAWRKKKIEEGWKDTCCGLLSPTEIEEAGFHWNNEKTEVMDDDGNLVLIERGYDAVPSQLYIEEFGETGRPKGTKYTGPSQRFLAWKKKWRGAKQVDDFVDEEMIKQATVVAKAVAIQDVETKYKPPVDEINVDDIPF